MRRVFVYEYLSGGGEVDGDPAAGAGLLPLGVAMRDALVTDLLGLPDCAVTAASCPLAPALPLGATAVRPHDGETPFAFVARQAALHDLVWLVAPETGGLLAQFRAGIDTRRWLGCGLDAITLTTSKRATLERLAGCGVSTPLACAHDAGTMRWVVKPDDGAGAVDTRVFDDRDAAHAEKARRAGRGEAVTLEPWVDGEPLSVSLHCGVDRAAGVEVLSVNRQAIGIDADGAVSFDGVDVDVLGVSDPRHGAIARVAGQVVRAIPGLRGFVGIDLVWHAQRGPVVIEVNPRVTCAYVGLSASLGRNLAAELLAAHAEEGVDALA